MQHFIPIRFEMKDYGALSFWRGRPTRRTSTARTRWV